MFLRRLLGIEVSRSFDVTEDGTDGKITIRNPDCPLWLDQIEEERRNSEAVSKFEKAKTQPVSKMAQVSLTGGDDIYAEIGGETGLDNPGFAIDDSAVVPAVPAEVETDLKIANEEDKADENHNFYASLESDSPGALDPHVMVDNAVDPGVKAVHGEAAVADEFPGEDFWAGCRSVDLKDWVEYVKSQPPDKVKPCVLNSSLPDSLKLQTSENYVDIVDPVFRNGRVEVQPPSRAFSYIKRDTTESRVPDYGEPVDCQSCFTKANCCSNVDKGRIDYWFWIGLAVFLIVIIIIIAIVVGVRSDTG